MQIPLIDCDPLAREEAAMVADIDAALRDVGFLALSNIGVDADALSAMFSVARAFFARPAEEKARCAYTSAAENFGYQAPGEESLDPAHPADLKETFTMRNLRGEPVVADRWPDDGFRQVTEQFYGQALRAARRLQRLLALALAVPEDYFVDCHGGENVTLRLLHYPAVDPALVGGGRMGAGAHTDYGMLTLLWQDAVGGLQVMDDDGAWHAVPPRPGTVVVNAGDMLECWSNGRYRSTRHRVLPRQRERYSIALFVDPDSATVIEPLPSCIDADNPPRFHRTTAGKHLQSRIEATHLAGP